MVSPHLDDAVLSLGASIASAVDGGARATVLSVFAGDPLDTGPPGHFDAVCGFASAGEAYRARRAEDASACALLGARPRWLPFWDVQYSTRRATDEELLATVLEALGDADVVLVPGYPLDNVDHSRLARLLVGPLVRRQARVGLYVEQPYAARKLLGARPTTTPRARSCWLPLPPSELAPEAGWLRYRYSPRAGIRKLAAISKYRSQLPRIGRLLRTRITAFELLAGGEAVAWLSGSCSPTEEAQAIS